MADFGILGNLIIHIQALIWFIFIGILIYLVFKTKLTYIDDFRQKFIAGIFILLISSSIFIIFQYYLNTSKEFLDLLNIFLLIGLVISSYLIIIGLNKLNDYIASIVDFEEQKHKNTSFVIALIASIISFIINSIIYGGGLVEYANRIASTFALFIYFYIFCYTYYLHLEIKDIKLNMMGFFGTGFMFVTAAQILGIFYAMLNEAFYWIIFNLLYLLLALFLIIGYIDFKNRIVQINTDIGA
ncbi:MAG: hypothetical protein ACTSO9_03020 [Candidatus Helarchaeota archaeon]